LLSGGILLLQVIAVSALGNMLTIIIKNSIFINMIMCVSVFVYGFMGGSFQDYMHNFDTGMTVIVTEEKGITTAKKVKKHLDFNLNAFTKVFY